MTAMLNKTKYRTLNDLLLLKLKALYDIETQISRSLPKVSKKTGDEELRVFFDKHIEETKNQVMRLEKIFNILEIRPATVKVDAVRGLVKDMEWVIKEKPAQTALDALLIASASYIEHYEMAGYTAAHRWAVRLGMENIADFLLESLNEEENAAKSLAELSEKIDARVM